MKVSGRCRSDFRDSRKCSKLGPHNRGENTKGMLLHTNGEFSRSIRQKAVFVSAEKDRTLVLTLAMVQRRDDETHQAWDSCWQTAAVDPRAASGGVNNHISRDSCRAVLSCKAARGGTQCWALQSSTAQFSRMPGESNSHQCADRRSSLGEIQRPKRPIGPHECKHVMRRHEIKARVACWVRLMFSVRLAGPSSLYIVTATSDSPPIYAR